MRQIKKRNRGSFGNIKAYALAVSFGQNHAFAHNVCEALQNFRLLRRRYSRPLIKSRQRPLSTASFAVTLQLSQCLFTVATTLFAVVFLRYLYIFRLCFGEPFRLKHYLKNHFFTLPPNRHYIKITATTILKSETKKNSFQGVLFIRYFL